MDYELIDTGDFRKLERFGKYIIDRPSKKAEWKKRLPSNEWDKRDLYFQRGDTVNNENTSLPDGWYRGTDFNSPVSADNIEPIIIEYSAQRSKLSVKFKIEFGINGQVGIFPEQDANWYFLEKTLQKIAVRRLKGTETDKKIETNTEDTGRIRVINIIR